MKGAPVDDPGDRDLSVSAPDDVAAGVPGVLAALRVANEQMGVRRSIKTMLKVNQDGGFDCPGCAWPEPHDRSHAEFCENGAKAVAEEATTRRIDADFWALHPVSELADRSDYWLGQQGRLTRPAHRPAGADHYTEIDWEDAFDLVADALNATGDPDRTVFYTSGRTSNEAAFLYQLLVRAYGTNNLPDCSNMCHESSGAALGETIGIGKGSVTLDDLHSAELIFVVGQNPGTNHPRMLTALATAKERGARIVAVNPLREAGLIRFKDPQKLRGVVGRGTEMADLYLQLKVASDLALFQLLNRRLVDADALDHDFIDEFCDGADELIAHLRTLDTDALLEATGLPVDQVDAAFELLESSERTIVCWAMGLTQHKDAVATIREIVNTLLLTGNIGKPGAGVCPVRGHSNVQGDRTMGISEKPGTAFLDALEATFGITAPRAPGRDTVDAIGAMARGEIDVFMAMGGNFVSAAPDTDATTAALARCRLTVQVSTKLNRSHVLGGEAALILPCLGRTEVDGTGGHQQFVTVEDSMGIVHASRGGLAPAHPELRSEPGIVAAIGRRIAPELRWAELVGDYDRIRDAIEAVVPGFEDFNDRARRRDGFALPHPPRDSRTFETPTGKARLTRNTFTGVEVPAGHLLLQTVRSHDQYNTTIYGLDDRYRGISRGRRVVLVNPADLADLGLADAEIVDVVGVHGGVERRAERFRLVAYEVARGTCAAYFPEANVLVPLDSVAVGSNTPTSKSIVVRFEPA